MQAFGVQLFRLAIALTIVGMSTSSAHAYLDPGTGSIILQVLLGGLAGLIVACKLYWQRFLALIGGRKQASDSKELSVSQRRGR
jgi:hypothetical protein